MTTTDVAEYGPVPHNVKHAVDLLVQAHGYASPIENMAAVIGWNAKWCPVSQHEEYQRVAALLAEAAGILKRLEQGA